jgi:hypothetical protein
LHSDQGKIRGVAEDGPNEASEGTTVGFLEERQSICIKKMITLAFQLIAFEGCF